MKTLNASQSNRSKVLMNTPPKKRCKTCQYRASDTARGCDFILITGKRRGCSAENCTAYVKGKRLSRRNEPAWSMKGTYEY